MNKILRAYLLPALAFAGLCLAGFSVLSAGGSPPPSQPLTEPGAAPFEAYVSGTGLTEAPAQAVDIARRTVALWRDSLSLARSRARAGTGAEIDAVQARAELESARATIPPLEQGAQQAALRLAVLTSQTPAAMLEALRQPRTLPSLSGGINPDPPLASLAKRPDIRAAERRIAAATA